MNSTLAESAGDRARGAAALTAKPLATQLFTLVRREFWEHRYLWLAPLVTQVLLLLLCAVIGHGHSMHIQLRDADDGNVTAADRIAAATIVQWLLAVPLFVVVLLLLSYYVLDCLYAERKDRSILFWKSLPVSDGLTVTAKALTALVVVPFGAFLLAVVGNLAFYAIYLLRVGLGSLPPVLTFDATQWLRTELVMFLGLVLGVLWYLPWAALWMLVSAWVRRYTPFLWAVVPLVLALVVEGILSSIYHQPGYLHQFLNYRTFHIWAVLGLPNEHVITHGGIHPVGSLLGTLDFGAAFADRDLWLGVVAAVLMLFAAARLRRWHDET
jgi:ABC-2 type transport system permease protein